MYCSEKDACSNDPFRMVQSSRIPSVGKIERYRYVWKEGPKKENSNIIICSRSSKDHTVPMKGKICDASCLVYEASHILKK
jgi:hypothetical protein